MGDAQTQTKPEIVSQEKDKKPSTLPSYTHKTATLSQRLALIYGADKELYDGSRDSVISEFLTLAACGQETQVLEVLKLYPQLLRETGIAKDYSGRNLQGTVYRIALGAEDFDLCKKLDVFFTNRADGPEEKKKQFMQQFPGGIIENKPNDYDFSALVSAIDKDNFVNNLPNAGTQEAIKKFHDYFTPNPKNVITTGKHFNMQHMVMACNVFTSNYEDWNGMQRSLFWGEIIGYLQRFVPACYAQAFCQGLFINGNNEIALERKLNLNKREVYFPLPASSSGLGWDFGVYSPTTRGWVPMEEESGGGYYRFLALKKYINEKHKILENIKLACTQTTSDSHKSQASKNRSS